MRKTSAHFYLILINIVSVHLFPNSTKYNPNDGNFDWSTFDDDLHLKKTHNVSLGSYNDYVELDYSSKNSFSNETSEYEQSDESLVPSYELSEELDYPTTKPRPNATNEFEQKLLDAEIFDDVIHAMPEKCLKVTMNHGDLIPGQRLNLLEAWDQPNITYEADPKHLHTLFLSCNSKYIPFSSESQSQNDVTKAQREISKWLIINIPGNNISAGTSLYKYTPPSRHHQKQIVDRYTFLLYKQRYKIKDEWLPDPVNGDFYSPGEINESYPFAQYYGLGNPIASNFFVMHW
ncbi:26 kDa secreted antigen-like [Planococcus citri]|uniref:26 kDa secreted antigen-like n=1 Tax=Planococcus citri TaxID=170843 RepID=UPI0031F77680